MSDNISRQAAIDAVHCRVELANKIEAMAMTSAIAEITRNIANLPSTDRKGHWVKRIHVIKTKNMEESMPIWNCSECGRAYDPFTADRFINFCPECGADMRGEQDEKQGEGSSQQSGGHSRRSADEDVRTALQAPGDGDE